MDVELVVAEFEVVRGGVGSVDCIVKWVGLTVMVVDC